MLPPTPNPTPIKNLNILTPSPITSGVCQIIPPH